jgi:hypothetical protein
MRVSRKSRVTRNFRRMRSKLAVLLMWSLLLQMTVQPFLAMHTYADTMKGLTITKSATKATVNAGEMFEYVIDFSYASGTSVDYTVLIEDTVPAEFEIISSDGVVAGQKVTSTEPMSAGDAGRISILVKARSIQNTKATVNTATLKTEEDPSIVINDTADVTVNKDPDFKLPPTVTDVVYDEWETFKYQDSGIAGNPSPVGGRITYHVGVESTAVAQNRVPGTLTVDDFIDQLPAAATRPDVNVTVEDSKVSNGSPVVWTHDPGNNVIEWAPFTLQSGQSFSAKVVVDYPDNAFFIPLSNQVNTVTLATYHLTEGILGGDEASVTTSFAAPKFGVPDLKKSRTYQYRSPGQTQKFTISGIKNSANGSNNSSLRNLVLEDTLPPEMDYTSIKMPGNKQTSKFEYQLGNKVDGTNVGPLVAYNSGNPVAAGTTLSIGDSGTNIIIPTTQYLKSVKWTFDSLAVGGTIGNIEIEGVVLEQVNGTGAPGTGTAITHSTIPVVNNVTLNYKAPNALNVWVDQPQKTAKAEFLINYEKPWLTANKEFKGSVNPRPLVRVPFVITIGNSIHATGDYVDPVIYDLLPIELNYYVNPKYSVVSDGLANSFQVTSKPASITTNPETEIMKGPGDRTLVKWSWPGGAVLKPGESIKIEYNGVVAAGTPQNTVITNDLFITTKNKDTQFWHNDNTSQYTYADFAAWKADPKNSAIKGLVHEPDNGNLGVDHYYVKASLPITIGRRSYVESTKWNKGELDKYFRMDVNHDYDGAPSIPDQPFDPIDAIEYTEFPFYSVTYEGGSADYKLVLRNGGNTRLLEIDVIDILPYVGDKELLSSSDRKSEWRPNLADAPSSGTNISYTAPGRLFQPVAPRTVKYNMDTFFSKTSHLIPNNTAFINLVNQVPTAGSGWIHDSAYPNDDLTDIRSLYFKLTNIEGSDGAPGLMPGDYIVLGWKMNAPVGTPRDSIAWNSFAIQATPTAAGGGAADKMLPTSPNKVGFIVDPENKYEGPPELGEIGDFVWFDSDSGGTQNENTYHSDGLQGAGINGITVRLYEEGIVEPIRTVKTGYNTAGKPGYYLFKGLTLNKKYQVEFVLPDHYSPTVANINGPDPGHTIVDDSNFVGTGVVDGDYTAYKTDLIELTLATRSNRTIDFGIVEAGSSPGQYPNIDLEKKIVGVAKGASSKNAVQTSVVTGNEVNYEIDVKNTSSVTIHNIKIADEMDRNQAGFTFTELTHEGSLVELSAINRPDVITTLVNSGANPHIIIKSLAPGQSIKLKGKYTVVAADLDGSDLENTITVNYNESTDPITDAADIPTASFTIEKTGSSMYISDDDVDKYIDYTVTIKNTGTADLTDIELSDTLEPWITPALVDIPSLLAGESKVINYSYKVPNPAPVNIVNTVTAEPKETPPASDNHDVPKIAGQTGSIGNYVWIDISEKGDQDEAVNYGVNGIAVKLFKDNKTGTPIAETITKDKGGEPGYYLFQGLPAGNYYVQFIVPNDYMVTDSEQTDSDNDSNVIDINGFTNVIAIGPTAPAVWDDLTIDLGLIPRGEIGNYVWLDRDRDGKQLFDGTEPGVNGIEVRLHKDNTTGTPVYVTVTGDKDGTAGYYLFDDLIAGTYYVEFVLPIDYEKTVPENGVSHEDSNGTTSVVNGTFTSEYTGAIVIGGAPGDPTWIDYTIDLGVVAKGKIGDYIWLDANNNGKQDETPVYGRNGIRVRLYDENKVFLEETVTKNHKVLNETGYYMFEHLTAGDYYVQFLYSGSYDLTRAEAAGVDPAEDSNKLTSRYTEKITIGPSGPRGWEDLTIDLGLVYSPDPDPIPPVIPPVKPPVIPPVEPPVTPPTDPVPPVTPPTEPPTDPIPPTEKETTPKEQPKEGEVKVPEGGKTEVGKPPENGKITIDEHGKWVYTPNPGFEGIDIFSIIIVNADGEEEEILFQIEVEPVPLSNLEHLSDVRSLPKTGERSYLPLQLLGLGLMFMSVALRKRYMRRKADPTND